MGWGPKVVQELLRHANLKTTMDTYRQALSPEKRKAHPGVIRMVVPRLVPACDKWLMPSLYLVETKMAGTTGLEPAASAVTALRE